MDDSWTLLFGLKYEKVVVLGVETNKTHFV